MLLPPHLPVLGICGFSGSGKTTLIEALLPRLRRQGLQVAVIKHDAHGLNIDQPGKDSDRFFQAGADVMASGPGEDLLRRHRTGEASLEPALSFLGRQADLVLVEGHKATPLVDKLWLSSREGEGPPDGLTGFLTVLPREGDRTSPALDVIARILLRSRVNTPLRAGILIGGRSTRMGRPKHLLSSGGQTWLERTVEMVQNIVPDPLLLGAGDIVPGLEKLQRLPDLPGRDGPLAGMLAAMRWDPWADWLFTACDMPALSPEALHWLSEQVQPGVRAVLPRRNAQSSHVEPLPAWYSFRSGALLEAAEGPSALADSPGVASPLIPPALSEAWVNFNTPEDLDQRA